MIYGPASKKIVFNDFVKNELHKITNDNDIETDEDELHKCI